MVQGGVSILVKQKKDRFGANLRTAGSTAAGLSSVTAPSSAVSRLLATAEQTRPLLGESAVNWDEAQIHALLQALPQQEQSRFLGFIDRFANLGRQLKDGIERAEALRLKADSDAKAAQVEVEATRSRLDDECARLNQRRSEEMAAHERINAIQQAMADQRVELDTRLRSLVGREATLVQREAELRGGLVVERENSLQVLRGQITDLETRRDRLPVEIEAKRMELLTLARKDADQIIGRAHERDKHLQQLELHLQVQHERQEQRERQLQLEGQLIAERRNAVGNEIRAEAQREHDELKAKLLRSQEKSGKLLDRIDSLQQELDELQEFRELSRGDPRGMAEGMESLRQKNLELDRRVQELLASRSEDDGERLRAERDDLRERLDGVEAELFDLRRRAGQWKQSVTEREDWESARQTLESNRTLLHKASMQLRADVKELVDRKQYESVFPELSRMDMDFNTPCVTAPPPENLGQLVDELQVRIAHSEPGKVLLFRKEELQLFLGGLAMSQLHIFQGISGTGKTTLAVAFAEAIGGQLTRVSVQAGWRDRADVLGHYNAFEKRYYERETLQAIYQAQTPAHRDRVHVVLLDEMNLSRPEQYFADFLSTMEMGKDKRWIRLMETAPAQAPANLRDGRDILLPTNLWFIGTANQDETTNAFADKTHDRAFVLDLPRQDERGVNLPKLRHTAPWSVDSLAASFDKACKKHAQHVGMLVKKVNASNLTNVLTERFQLGWGNRLERQMLRFIPVVTEAGGSDGLALDHLLASRMFRDGKVTGRFDVKSEDLLRVQEELLNLWADCGLNQKPIRCLAAIDRDVQRLENRG